MSFEAKYYQAIRKIVEKRAKWFLDLPHFVFNIKDY